MMPAGAYEQAPDPKETRPKQNKKNETVKLQSEITNEVTRDAPHIAQMVFGDAKDHPDVVGLPNERLDAIYHQKYLEQDRPWLQAEARRDPEQFLKVSQRIGVQMPDPNAPPPAPVPTPAPVAAPPPMPPAPMAPPMPVVGVPPPVPVVPPAPVVAAPPPVILGPNGQPLPPSGLV